MMGRKRMMMRARDGKSHRVPKGIEKRSESQNMLQSTVCLKGREREGERGREES